MIRALNGDCREILPKLDAESFDCIVTSPPYWGLRDYGTAKWEGGDAVCDHATARINIGNSPSMKSTLTTNGGRGPKEGDKFSAGSQFGYAPECSCGARRVDAQIGLEPTLDAYVETMVAVGRELWRVLKPSGTVWLNLGDCYAANRGGTYQPAETLAGGKSGKMANGERVNRGRNDGYSASRDPKGHGLKHKDLCGVPWRVAFALQADGWWLRSAIVWAKPNPMPESVTDRPTSAYEMVFLLTKAERYFYDADAIAERAEFPGVRVATPYTQNAVNSTSTTAYNDNKRETKNARNVWTIASQPYSGAHFATMPPDLAERCIKAGSSEKGVCLHCGKPWERCLGASVPTGGRGAGNGFVRPERLSVDGRRDETVWVPKSRETVGWRPTCACPPHEPVPASVLDPFGGAGTTGLVADRLGRNATLIELNPAYRQMSAERIVGDAPLFADVR